MVSRSTLCLAVVATLAVGVAPAHAAKPRPGRAVLVTPKGRPLPGPYQRWVNRAKVPTVRGRVRIVLTGCPRRPRFAGCVFSKRKSTIYMKRRTSHTREVLLHELGHLFDLRVLGRADRRDFKRIMGRPRRSWYRGVNPPAEQFAEAYALCALRKRINRRVTGGYGFKTGPQRHRRSCAVITRTVTPKSPPPAPPPNPPPVSQPPPQSEPPPGQPEQEEEPSLLDQVGDLLPG